MREGSHLRLHLVLDAILSTALALAIFQLATAPSRHDINNVLRNSGAVAFSAQDLQEFLKEEKLAAYWAGPEPNFKYTVIATTPGEVTITYFPINADIHRADTSILVVQTHNHIPAGGEQDYLHNVSVPGNFLMNQGSTGNSIEFNPANPYKVMVTMRNQYSTVTIFNSVPEAALALAMRPGAVQKVSQV